MVSFSCTRARSSLAVMILTLSVQERRTRDVRLINHVKQRPVKTLPRWTMISYRIAHIMYMKRSQVITVMCNTVDMEVNVKKVDELTHTGDEKVELHTTSSGIPVNPTRRSDTAKLARMILLLVLSFE